MPWAVGILTIPALVQATCMDTVHRKKNHRFTWKNGGRVPGKCLPPDGAAPLPELAPPWALQAQRLGDPWMAPFPRTVGETDSTIAFSVSQRFEGHAFRAICKPHGPCARDALGEWHSHPASTSAARLDEYCALEQKPQIRAHECWKGPRGVLSVGLGSCLACNWPTFSAPGPGIVHFPGHGFETDF